MSKDFWRWQKPFKEDLKMSWSYINKINLNLYNLRDKLDISEIIDIFTSEDVENMSRPQCGFVWILRVVYFPVKHLCLCTN